MDTTKLKPRFKTVPPLLSLFTMKELEESIDGGPVTLPDIPCHSQHVITIIKGNSISKQISSFNINAFL